MADVGGKDDPAAAHMNPHKLPAQTSAAHRIYPKSRRNFKRPDSQINLARGGMLQQQAIPLSSIKKINPPPVKWTGNVVVGGILARGNTQTENLNAATHLMRRGDQDRITFDAQYLYGREKITGDGNHETQNNWYIEGKYDYFFNPRFYAYANARVERDVIADISLRLTPGVGVGYQWVEKPNFAFNTEAGAAWLYRSYSHDGRVDSASARLVYHLTAKFNDKVSAFHNFEYFPGLDRMSNYFFDTDAGIRATLTEQMFAEFKVEERYDSQPAPGRGRNDTRYIVGVGWNF
jgi:putative salt-induced outer membrane protein YdiY